ncbi:hypothetical protein NQD34_014588 [Periophthalmus magnuspinnatus]|nr:hypothetical protein NQD34_014588 [Periophthalmus magnuspinnatus]
MAEPLLKRTLSRFRTKSGPKAKDVPPAATPTSPPHLHLTLPCTNQSTALATSSHNAPGHEAGPGLNRSLDSPSLCVPKSCSSPSSGLSPDPILGPSPGPGLGPVLRSPRRGAYLQSLESSSRAWVLSDHTHAPPPVQRGEGLIWYNPIPEDEDGLEGRGAGLKISGAGTEEQTEDTEDKTEAKVTPEHSGGVSERVIDRLRSPGVKLRRKLSLKSRRDRQGNSNQDTPPTVQDTPPQDSSSPSRKRPIRRQHSGRKGCDSNDEELLPQQQMSPQQGEEPSVYSPSHGLTGVLTVHLQRLDLPTHRSGESRCVSVVIQVDDVIRARTAAMTMTGPTLRLDHAFHLQLERAQKLRVLLLTRVNPDPQVKTISRTRLCGAGGASLASVFTPRGSQTQDLALALEPRGTLLLRLSLQAGEETGVGASLSVGGAQVFGAELTDLVQRESSEKPVPLIIQKTVTEINRRGLKVQGVYRLCGSSSLKKQLRDSFESDSSSVELQECPDLHAVTGVLKDYLHELPSPLITPSLYEAVKEVMTSDPCVTADPVQLLQCLPPVHRATLSYLMDHLSLVSSFSSLNKMSAQNLAVCFGAVFFAAVQTDQWECGAAERSLSAQGVDFKQHIEALHFLLSHWPVPPLHVPQEEEGGARDRSPEAVGGAPEHRCRGRDLRHRQAGDWSRYQQREPGPVEEEEAVLDFEAPFNCRLSLKDFDLLIQDFHRQLNQV